MSAYLTEAIKTYENHGNPSDPNNGREMLTITIWIGDERFDTVSETFGGTADEAREKALALAKQIIGLTADDLRSYDDFVRKMDKTEWNH